MKPFFTDRMYKDRNLSILLRFGVPISSNFTISLPQTQYPIRVERQIP